MSRLAAAFLVLFALILGTGGGCLIGDWIAPRSATPDLQMGWSINGGLIGAVLGLAAAYGIIGLRRRRR
jgi:hypothetical protein